MKDNNIAHKIRSLKHAHCYLLYRVQQLCGAAPAEIAKQLDNAQHDFWVWCVPEYDAICESLTSTQMESETRMWNIANYILAMLGLLEDKLEQAAQNEDVMALREAIKAIVGYAEDIPGSMKLWVREINDN